MRFVLLLSVSVFCLVGLVACDLSSPATPEQLTEVVGTVTSATTGRPLPGVLLAIESYKRGFFGPVTFTTTADSVRTNAQGRYTLHFNNKDGLYYVVSIEPVIANRQSRFSRYTFITNDMAGGPGLGPGQREPTIGRASTIDFKPDELRTVAVRIRNRNTGYQRLDFNYRTLRGNNLDTLAYLRGFYLPAAGVKFRYYNVNAANQVTKDTLVALVLQNPAALPPDTLRATLTFVR